MQNRPSIQIALRLEDVTMAYGRALALDSCSFSIEAGEIAGYIGPNGAGKTTTLRILATLLKPDSGLVEVLGEDISRASLPDIRRRLGYMSERPSISPGMPVVEYLDYCAATYRIRRSGREQLVRDVLDLTDLVEMADFPTDGLSRGNRQRLALARTLINDPEVLLLDEPASGLDPIARVEFRELLKTLHGMGKTILISSHILSELGDLCSKVFMISEGRIIASGKVDELLGELSHRSTLEFTFATDQDALHAEGWFKRNHPSFFEQYVGNRVDRCLRFSGAVEELEIGFLLKSMIQEEIRVIFCNRTTPSLEDVFLDKTVGR